MSNHLHVAENSVLMTDHMLEAQTMIQNLYKETVRVGLEIKSTKTQYMTNLVLSDPIKIDDNNIEQVGICKYLGHEISIRKDNQTHQFEWRIGLAWAAFERLRIVFRSDLFLY